jgi:lysophospholipase L1-like esterase
MMEGILLRRLLIAVLTVSFFSNASGYGQDATASQVDAAILGDSISTGGGSHPALKYDVEALWDVFNNKVSVRAEKTHLNEYYQGKFATTELTPPLRLWPTMREFFGGPDWVYRNLLGFFSRKFLDSEEYSWGYLAASELGIDASRLAIAADDGARVANMPRQIDRVLQFTGGKLPPKIFIFYTGNDLCGMDPSLMTTAADYKTHLMRGLTYLARNSGKTKDEIPTDVYLMSYMSLVQLLDDQPILDKKIVAFGKETTCAGLRKDGYRSADPAYSPKIPPEAWYFAMAMPPNPAAFCPTLFAPQKFVNHSLSDLANRIREYRQAETEVVAEFNKAAEQELFKSLKLHHIVSTAGLKFTPEEVGEDCFHLSLRGQEKLARSVAEEISKKSAH